jgi:hypothetical protein
VRWEDWHRKGAEDDEASRAAARALGKETGHEESSPAAGAEGPATQDESEEVAVDIAVMSIEEKAADQAREEQPSRYACSLNSPETVSKSWACSSNRRSDMVKCESRKWRTVQKHLGVWSSGVVYRV